MKIITLSDWIEQLKARFDERALKYMSAQKAKIYLQLKDAETGEIHLHKFEYEAKKADHLRL